MSKFIDALQREKQRLLKAPGLDQVPGGMGTVRFVGHTTGSVQSVIDRAKELLLVVNRRSEGKWPNDNEWAQILPAWFVECCERERSQEEAEQWLKWWRSLSDEEQARIEKNQAWSLSSWTHWLTPENRLWFWWDAAATSDHDFVVAVEALDWPFPSGALQWLLRACGADSVEPEV